jgi:hypothetical protein
MSLSGSTPAAVQKLLGHDLGSARDRSDGDALALEVGERPDAAVLRDDELERFGEQRNHRSDEFLRLALVFPSPPVRRDGDAPSMKATSASLFPMSWMLCTVPPVVWTPAFMSLIESSQILAMMEPIGSTIPRAGGGDVDERRRLACAASVAAAPRRRRGCG